MTLAAGAAFAGMTLFAGTAFAATPAQTAPASMAGTLSCGIVPGPCNPGCVPQNPGDCSGTESPAPPVDKKHNKNSKSDSSSPSDDPDSHSGSN